MNLTGKRILLTGAAGGIGAATARALAARGAQLVLAGREPAALQQLAAELRAQGAHAEAVVANLGSAESCRALVNAAEKKLGGIDVLINAAGLLDFTPFEAHDPGALARLMQVNLLVPMQLAQAVLPGMRAAHRGRIVNVGSTFGSIAFPFFAAYSASKFGLRGFSQALRRELTGSGIGVTYVSPRATRTAFNPGPVVQMNEALKVAMDSPETVATAIAEAIARERDEVFLGWPEKLFVRINALWPSLVDGSLRKQLPVMRRFVAGK